MPKTAPATTGTAKTRSRREHAERLLPLRKPAPPAPERVAFGELLGPWGVRGEQAARLFNPASDLLERVDAVFVEGKDFSPREVSLAEARWVGKRYVVRMAGVESPDDAEHLRGLELSVRESALPDLDGPDEYYVRDLVGLKVVDGGGREIGALTEVLSTGSNDVYVVVGADGERLIPSLRAFVASVDLDEGLVRLTEDGLDGIPVTRGGKEL
jgi:16S rRNA processing protein RimM